VIPLDTAPGWQAVLTFVGVIAVALIAASVPWLTLRNERAIANAEADLLAKLDPADASAKELKRLIDARINRWTQRAFKKDAKSGKEVTPSVASWWLLGIVAVLAAIAVAVQLFVALSNH
jgi:hypothetical protein